MKLLALLLLGSHLLLGHFGELLADERIAVEKRELVATVLGKPIYQVTPAEAAAKRKELSDRDYERWLRAYRADWLLSRITGSVLKEYAIREKLSPSDDQIEALLGEAARKYSGNFKADKDSQRDLALRMSLLWGSSCEWRTAKALHEKYGGRVGITSFGGHMSFEGRNAVLKEYATAGEIKFHHADLERAFWEKTRDERFSDVTLAPDRVARHFAVSPWERWLREQAQKDVETKDQKKPESKLSPAQSK